MQYLHIITWLGVFYQKREYKYGLDTNVKCVKVFEVNIFWFEMLGSSMLQVKNLITSTCTFTSTILTLTTAMKHLVTLGQHCEQIQPPINKKIKHHITE